jgi:hypothetical protein
MDTPPLRDTIVAFSCDEQFFPLAKGLVLSLIEAGAPDLGARMALLDIGCSSASLGWFRQRGVEIRVPRESVMGPLADPSLGYHRSQVCRPFLPELFPGAKVYIWLDSDTWVQDVGALVTLRSAALLGNRHMGICPECHYSYLAINDDGEGRRAELQGYYQPIYGESVATRMANRPVLNSGVFALAADSALWNAWKSEVADAYSRDYPVNRNIVLHYAEQVSLNVLLANRREAALVDPLNNYLCFWHLPHRDAGGVVRVSLLPNPKIGIVHLCGWRWHGKQYLDLGLLFRSGAYLDAREREMMLGAVEGAVRTAMAG